MKTRVWELAQELGIQSKDLLQIAQENNIPVAHRLSGLEKQHENLLRNLVTQKGVSESPKKGSEEAAKTGAIKKTQDEPVVEKPQVVEEESEKDLPIPVPAPVESSSKMDPIQVQPSEKLEAQTLQAPAVNEPPAQEEIKTQIVEPALTGTISEEAPKSLELQPAKEAPAKEAPVKEAPAAIVVENKHTQVTRPEAETKVDKKKENSYIKEKVGENKDKIQKKSPHIQPARHEKFHTKVKEEAGKGSLTKGPVLKERPIEVVVPISIKDLSQAIGVRTAQIITKLFSSYNLRVSNHNQPLNEEYVEAIGLEFGKNIKIKKGEDPEENLIKELEFTDNPQDLVPRAPVVTFMGHVDHGKTSLLDKIRKTNVTAKEAGGITQHIGASKITTNGNSIVFLDTPGHEAFTAMRSRGANITDIVVLVVAADDGIMPQTVEAINHAKAANVDIIVALNKIDKPNARPEQVMQQLMRYNLIPEKWQGETICVEVSAITGQGIDQLLEYIGLVAEMRELKANPKRKALGAVLESKIMEGKGPVATLLVQNGTLRRGDLILCGNTYGRVRDISDHLGNTLKEAGPSTPVEISGLSDIPEAGDKFYVVNDQAKAKEIAENRQKRLKEKSLAQGSRKMSLEEIMKQIQQGDTKELCLVLKTDVQGSMEAISAKIHEISHQEIKVKLLHAAVGGINETDIQLAYASKAVVLGFNVTPSKVARDLAEEKGIEIRRYSVIYHLLEDLKKMMGGMLSPEEQEKITGHAMVRQTIKISKIGTIAGCYVTDGTIERNARIRISRQGVIINKDKPFEISSLKRFKDDVSKVKEGFECGIKLEGFEDIKEGDELEAFQIVQVARSLE